MKRLQACLFLTLALGACTPAATSKENPAVIARRAAALAPPDARLADLYAHACKACHAAPASGAPLAGDEAGPRLITRIERVIVRPQSVSPDSPDRKSL